MKEYSKMDKFELIKECIEQESLIDHLKWELDCEKRSHLYDKGFCPLKKDTIEEIIACTYNCDDCFKRRESYNII